MRSHFWVSVWCVYCVYIILYLEPSCKYIRMTCRHFSHILWRERNCIYNHFYRFFFMYSKYACIVYCVPKKKKQTVNAQFNWKLYSQCLFFIIWNITMQVRSLNLYNVQCILIIIKINIVHCTMYLVPTRNWYIQYMYLYYYYYKHQI